MEQKYENTVKTGNFISKIDLWKLLKIIPFVFALHEFEEWNILKWHQKYQSNIPDVTDIDLRTIFLFIIGAIFIIFYIASKLKNKKTGIYILFPVLFFMVYNGLVHLYWSIYFSTYFPGLIFGFLISVPLIGIILYKIISENIVSKWFIYLIVLISTGMLLNAVFLGDKLEAGIVKAMLLGKVLAEWIWF